MLTVEAPDSDENLVAQFARTVLALKRGDDKKLNAAIPPLETIESRLKLLPKSLIVDAPNYDVRLLANNHLERVSFSAVKLLPKGIWNLEFLKELHLNNCGLTQLPDRLYKLRDTLSILDMSNNKITKIDARLAIYFKQLKHLNLSNNEIRVIPLELVFIRSLLHLDLSRNLISKIPFTIGLMKSLKQLNLAHNRLDHFPESIIRPLTNSAKMLLRLDTLDLSGNQVTPAALHAGPAHSLLRSESLQKEMVHAPHVSLSNSPPSLFEISSRAALKCTKWYRVFHSWLPHTVYDFLQENAALCTSCTAACVAYLSAAADGPGHFSLLANTIQTDAATNKIPIVRFLCWHCALSRTDVSVMTGVLRGVMPNP